MRNLLDISSSNFRGVLIELISVNIQYRFGFSLFKSKKAYANEENHVNKDPPITLRFARFSLF